MTTEDMRDAVEAVYGPALKARGGQFPVEVPEGVTPQAWWISYTHEAEKLSALAFEERHAQAAGETLANMGFSYGCDTFAHLRVQDRAEAQVRGQGGAGRPRKRERAFIVHALGWKA